MEVIYMEFFKEEVLLVRHFPFSARIPAPKEEIYLKGKYWNIHEILNNLDTNTIRIFLTEKK